MIAAARQRVIVRVARHLLRAPSRRATTQTAPPSLPQTSVSARREGADDNSRTPPPQDRLNMDRINQLIQQRQSKTSPSSPPSPSTVNSIIADQALIDEQLSTKNAFVVEQVTKLSSQAFGRDESAVSPRPLLARYKPTVRTAQTDAATVQPHMLTSLQLHRLLTLHTLNPQLYTVAMLSERFMIDATIVDTIVRHCSVPVLVSGGGTDSEGMSRVGVWPSQARATNQRGEVMGHHLVTHLQEKEEAKR